MKFKVGDKVRLIQNSLNRKYLVGDTVTIEYIDGNGGWQNRVTNGSNTFDWIADDWAKLISQPSLPINITFKNKYEHQAMQQFLFDNGCKWNGYKKTIYTGYCAERPDIYAISVGIDRVMWHGSRESQAPTFTINDLDTIKEILNPSKPITKFELNSSYTAEIDPNTETVKVGCQTFTFAKIKELASKLEAK